MKRPLGEVMVQTKFNTKSFPVNRDRDDYPGMLSQVLPTRTRQHITSIFRLHLHQHFNHTLISTSEEKDNSRHSPTPVVPEDVHHGARIRTWEPIHNLADAWALLRVVERKYGKILEAGFVRVSLQYFPTCLPAETAIFSGF